MTLTNQQLMMLRSLVKKGWPAELIDHLPPRCGAVPDDFSALVSAGLTEERYSRFVLTEQGKREYRRQKTGRYF